MSDEETLSNNPTIKSHFVAIIFIILGMIIVVTFAATAILLQPPRFGQGILVSLGAFIFLAWGLLRRLMKILKDGKTIAEVR